MKEREPQPDATLPNKVVKHTILQLFEEDFAKSHTIDKLEKDGDKWNITFKKKKEKKEPLPPTYSDTW